MWDGRQDPRRLQNLIIGFSLNKQPHKNRELFSKFPIFRPYIKVKVFYS